MGVMSALLARRTPRHPRADLGLSGPLWARAAAIRRLTNEQWHSEVVSAQGRIVPATDIPWLRARELCVHTVDLGLGVTFADLPMDFLEALCADVVAKRDAVPDVGGSLPERAAWLTGRPHQLHGVPDLGAWL
jgi:maleylpyruvate isomerase